MELSHEDGKLHVHYSDKLVTLLREVRQLAAFGFTIPVKIQSTANTAQLFYKHGVILKQAREFSSALFNHYRIKYSKRLPLYKGQLGLSRRAVVLFSEVANALSL